MSSLDSFGHASIATVRLSLEKVEFIHHLGQALLPLSLESTLGLVQRLGGFVVLYPSESFHLLVGGELGKEGFAIVLEKGGEGDVSQGIVRI